MSSSLRKYGLIRESALNALRLLATQKRSSSDRCAKQQFSAVGPNAMEQHYFERDS